MCLASFAFGATTQPDAAQPPAVPEAPAVSIHLQGVPREQALDEFARASQMKFDAPAAGFWSAGNWPTPTVNLDIEDEPFWTALSHVEEALDVGFTSAGGSDHIAVTRDRGDWGWTGRPEAACGPFLLSVRQVGRRTVVMFQDPGKSIDRISMTLHVLVQPGLNSSIDDDGFQVTSLTTDQGADLRSQVYPFQVQRYGGADHIQIQVEAEAPSQPKIASVTVAGECRCLSAEGMHTIDIADAERAPSDDEVAGFAVQIVTKRSSDQVAVRLSAKLPHGGDQKALQQFGRRLWSEWGNQIQLFDADGSQLSSNSSGTTGGNRDVGMYLNYPAPKAKAPLRLKWIVPTRITETSIPFKVEDIPVP